MRRESDSSTALGLVLILAIQALVFFWLGFFVGRL